MGDICKKGCINNVLIKICEKQRKCKKIIPFIIYKKDGKVFKVKVCRKKTSVFMVVKADCFCAYLIPLIKKKIGKKCKFVPTKDKVLIDLSCFCGIECMKKH